MHLLTAATVVTALAGASAAAPATTNAKAKAIRPLKLKEINTVATLPPKAASTKRTKRMMKKSKKAKSPKSYDSGYAVFSYDAEGELYVANVFPLGECHPYGTGSELVTDFIINDDNSFTGVTNSYTSTDCSGIYTSESFGSAAGEFEISHEKSQKKAFKLPKWVETGGQVHATHYADNGCAGAAGNYFIQSNDCFDSDGTLFTYTCDTEAQTLDLYTYAATDDGVCVGDGTFVGTVDEQCVADTDDDGSGGADDDDHEFEFTTFTCTNGEKSAKSPKEPKSPKAPKGSPSLITRVGSYLSSLTGHSAKKLRA